MTHPVVIGGLDVGGLVVGGLVTDGLVVGGIVGGLVVDDLVVGGLVGDCVDVSPHRLQLRAHFFEHLFFWHFLSLLHF